MLIYTYSQVRKIVLSPNLYQNISALTVVQICNRLSLGLGGHTTRSPFLVCKTNPEFFRSCEGNSSSDQACIPPWTVFSQTWGTVKSVCVCVERGVDLLKTRRNNTALQTKEDLLILQLHKVSLIFTSLTTKSISTSKVIVYVHQKNH